MRYGLTLISALVLASCTPPAVAVQTVREAGPSEVVNCVLLGQVKGVPGVFGPFARIGLNDARKAAKRAALEQGADTVVFDEITDVTQTFEVTGQAYKCD